MPATVVILTKLPGHLPIKTRLVPVLGEVGARELYLEMLYDTIAFAKRITPRPVVAYSPPDVEPELTGLEGCELMPVEGDDGATCLENALAVAYAGDPLLALGGDAPDLPVARLEQAAAALEGHDAVFVPTGDGGFSCLGLRRPVPGLAAAFDFGSDRSLASLRTFLERSGLAVIELAPWPDVDTPKDLEAYRRRLRDG
ncbi:MAG: TIGR04282 family arsenosugar biosynthesis glycosyltransferase [Planctomycetota bacterium]